MKQIKELIANTNKFYVVWFLSIAFEYCSLNGATPLTDYIFPLLLLYLYRDGNIKWTLNEKIIAPYKISIMLMCLIAFIDVMRIGDIRTFFSQCRLLVNASIMLLTVGYFAKKKEKITSFLNAYELFCVISSICVILQFVFVYIFGIVIKLDFGDYQIQQNWASAYNEINDGSRLYRTGGLFNEPSWFSIFVSPALFITKERNHLHILMVIILGLLFSTSNLGFALIGVFAIFNLKRIRHIFLLFVVMLPVYFIFPQIFSRFTEQFIVDKGFGSGGERWVEPLDFLSKLDIVSLFGINISSFRFDIFLGTYLFVFLAFGVVGLLLFSNLIYVRKSLGLSIVFFAAVITDGCYGRIDFWMALCAAHLFSYYYLGSKNNMNNLKNLYI